MSILPCAIQITVGLFSSFYENNYSQTEDDIEAQLFAAKTEVQEKELHRQKMFRNKYFAESHSIDAEREFWRELCNDEQEKQKKQEFNDLVPMNVAAITEEDVEKDIWNIRHLSDPSEKLQIYVVEKNGNMLPFLPNPTTTAVYVAAIKNTFQAYMYVPFNMKYDVDILQAYFQSGGYRGKNNSCILTRHLMAGILNMNYSTETVQQLITCAVKHNGMCICNIPKYLVTRELKFMAIRQSCGYAIQGIVNPSDELIMFATSMMGRCCPVRKAFQVALTWNRIGRGSKDRHTGQKLPPPVGFKAFLLKKGNVGSDINKTETEDKARLYGFSGYEFPAEIVDKQPIRYEENGGQVTLNMCGFHFCLSPFDVEKYKMTGHDGTVYAMISILGDSIFSEHVCVTNQFRIKKFLTLNELHQLQNEYK